MTLSDKRRSSARKVNRKQQTFYRPIWHVRVGALMAFRPEFKIDLADAKSMGKSYIEAVLDILMSKDESIRTTLVLLPIKLKFLSNQTNRKALGDILGMLDIPMRNRLVIEVSGIPDYMQGEDLNRLLAPFLPFCRGVICLTELDERSFERFKYSGIFAVGFDLDCETERGEVELIDRITQFVHRANRYRFKAIAYGIRTTSLTTSAICAGVNFVSGDAIHEVISTPPGALHFKPQQLFGLEKPHRLMNG